MNIFCINIWIWNINVYIPQNKKSESNLPPFPCDPCPWHHTWQQLEWDLFSLKQEHIIKVRDEVKPTVHFTHWVWVVRDLALECRDQKATVNQTQAILTAYNQTYLFQFIPNLSPWLIFQLGIIPGYYGKTE